MSSHLSELASLSEARSVVAAEGARSLRQKSAQSQRMAALRAAWLAHTIKRAIAAASSASDADYRLFGWDREELLAQLRWLRGDLGGSSSPLAADGRHLASGPLRAPGRLALKLSTLSSWADRPPQNCANHKVPSTSVKCGSDESPTIR